MSTDRPASPSTRTTPPAPQKTSTPPRRSIAVCRRFQLSETAAASAAESFGLKFESQRRSAPTKPTRKPDMLNADRQAAYLVSVWLEHDGDSPELQRTVGSAIASDGAAAGARSGQLLCVSFGDGGYVDRFYASGSHRQLRRGTGVLGRPQKLIPTSTWRRHVSVAGVNGARLAGIRVDLEPD